MGGRTPEWMEDGVAGVGVIGDGVDRLELVRVRGQTVVLTAVTDSTIEVDEAGQLVTEAGQDRMVMVSVEY